MIYGQKNHEDLRQVRSAQDPSQHDVDGICIDCFRRFCATRGIESIRGCRTFCEGIGCGCDAPGGSTIGGILRQLLEEDRSRLARVETEADLLRDRIQFLEKNLRDLDVIVDLTEK